jgi:hypothetical protein
LAILTKRVHQARGGGHATGQQIGCRDLRATKMLIVMLKDAEKKAGVSPPFQPAPAPTVEEAMATFIARLRQSWGPSSCSS